MGEVMRKRNLALYEYQGRREPLQEIIHYCKHAEIDSRIRKEKCPLRESPC